jgi:hypothetical protein
MVSIQTANGTNVALERDGGDRRSCDWQVHDEHPLQARFVNDHAAEDGPEDRRQEHRQPEDGERPADCCGPARCATSVNPIGTTMAPRQACSTRKAISSRAVSTARTGTSRHRRARSPRPRRLGAAALGGPSGQGSGPPARRGSDPRAPGAPTERRSPPSAAVDADRWVAGGIARSSAESSRRSFASLIASTLEICR